MILAEPPDGTTIPSLLYSCANDSCAEERSVPASELCWVPSWNDWYCESCIDELCEDGEIEVGVSLAEWLETRRIVAIPVQE